MFVPKVVLLSHDCGRTESGGLTSALCDIEKYNARRPEKKKELAISIQSKERKILSGDADDVKPVMKQQNRLELQNRQKF